MAKKNYYVTIIKKGTTSTFSTSVSAYSEAEAKQLIQVKYPGCKIVGVK